MPLEQLLAAAASVGVPRIVQVGCDLPGARWAVQMAEQHEALVAAVALHPNEAPRLAADGALGATRSRRSPSWRPPGTGPRRRARPAWTTSVPGRRGGTRRRSPSARTSRWRTGCGKTLVIHDRDAHAEVLRVLDDEGVPERTVMHCFSGDADFARSCLDRGAWLCFAGTVTFANAQPLRDALAVTPLDRVLVETDAPYLTPVPYRGRPNASYLVPHTMRLIAEVLGRDLAEVCAAVDANTEAAFGGPW